MMNHARPGRVSQVISPDPPRKLWAPPVPPRLSSAPAHRNLQLQSHEWYPPAERGRQPFKKQPSTNLSRLWVLQVKSDKPDSFLLLSNEEEVTPCRGSHQGEQMSLQTHSCASWMSSQLPHRCLRPRWARWYQHHGRHRPRYWRRVRSPRRELACFPAQDTRFSGRKCFSQHMMSIFFICHNK